MREKYTFNEVVLEYEKIRPTYPKALYADIVNYSKIDKHDHILEIGSGTGKGTLGFVNAGYHNITCVELGGDLVRFTANKFSEIPSMKFYLASFEEWEGEEEGYSLAISATAFHFIDHRVGYPKVHRHLRKGGKLAFFWTVHVPSFDHVFSQIRNAYQKYAPHLDDSKGPTPDEIINLRKKEIMEVDLFHNVLVKEYSWIDVYTSEEYVSLLNTNSRHRVLDGDQKQLLFDDIKGIIDANGGKINKQQHVALFLATKS